MNFNFNDPNRKAEYPKLYDVLTGTDHDILYWIESLPSPSKKTEINIFNEVLNQYHLRGGR